MILREEDLIKKNLQNVHLEQKVLKWGHKYLKHLYANYLFCSFENKHSKERLVSNTHPLWHKNFIDSKLIDHCPLYATSVSSAKRLAMGRDLFLWNQIIPEGKEQKEVVAMRKEHGIANGISMTEYTKDYQLIVGVATDPCDHELEKKWMLLMPKIITLFAEIRNYCFQERISLDTDV